MATTDPARMVAVRTASLGTLERLARVDAHGHPVLSIYIDFDARRFPTPAARAAQLGSLLDEARRQAGESEVARVEALLSTEPSIGRGGNGLAIFSSAGAGFLELVRLTDPVEPLAVVDTIPWLEPLAAVISPDGWGVAVLSRRGARLLRGGPAGLIEFAVLTDEVQGRHAQGGWSQARFQRGIEEQVAAHIRGVAERLLRAHRRSPFAHLVIVCSGELRPIVEHSLHSDLTEAVAAFVDADLEHAGVEQIVQAVAPVVEQAEFARELDLVRRIEEALGTGGPAAAGLDEVLSTLEQQRVAVLLVPSQADLQAERCPTCGRLSTGGSGVCPLDGASLTQVDAVEHAIEEAGRQAAQVVVVRHQNEWLRERGKIAALLRW